MLTRRETILFRHCDPAGIVFYPRYFEMVTDTVEAYFAHIGYDFAAIHAAGAVPTAQISAEFKAPLRLGDVVELRFSLTHLGRTSLAYRIECVAFDAWATLVHTGADLRPEPWPQALRDRLQQDLQTP